MNGRGQRRKCSEKVHAGNGHTVAKAVRARILERRKRGIRIDVKRQEEARCPDRPDALAAKDKVIGKEMNEGT